jgi:hypothetical protein
MILRRLRGIAITAILWAIPWALIAGSVAALAALVLRVRANPARVFGQGSRIGLYWGLAAGALFASALMLAEQTRGFAGLTRARGALWGALAGIWFPAMIGLAFGVNSLPFMLAGWPAYLMTGAMGALSGLAMVALAGRGSGREANVAITDKPVSDLPLTAPLGTTSAASSAAGQATAKRRR